MKEQLLKYIQFKRFASVLSKDWALRIISLVLAVILWHYVGGEDKIDKNVMIPIEIINLPRDLVISNQFKKEIEVTVSGPRSIILDMVSRAVTRQVDLSAATPGTMVIENDNDHIPVPRGITVQRVQPSSIILSLDKLIQKQFPVSARTVGRVADGYYLKSFKTDPDLITITGPQTALSLVDELYTKTINLSGLKESSQLQVPLDLEPEIVELIGETSVTADLNIDLETVQRTIESMPVHVVQNGIIKKVQPETVKIIANFPKLLMDGSRKPEDMLSVTAIRQEGKKELKVMVIPKADVELPIHVLSIQPPMVQLVDGLAAVKEDMEKNNGAAKIPAQQVAAPTTEPAPVPVEPKATTAPEPAAPTPVETTNGKDTGRNGIPHLTSKKSKTRIE